MREMGIMKKKIYDKTLDFLNECPDHKDNMKKAIMVIRKKMKKHPNDKYYEMFEWDEVQVSYQKIKKWLLSDIVSLPYKSSKHKQYKFINIDETEKAIDDYNKIEKTKNQTQDNKSIQITNDIFDCIYGMKDIKEMMQMALKADRQVHVCLWGPPATAKSLFLLEISRIEDAHYVVGSSATKVGLSEILMDHKPQLLLIDEIDKLAKHPDDLSVLLSLMENGLVKNVKHGKHNSVKLHTKVFAAGNVSNLPAELDSRFLSLTLKEYSEQEFKKVAVYYLVKTEKTDNDLAEYITDKVYRFSRDVRKVRHIARICKTKDEVDMIIKMIQKYDAN